MSHSAHANNKTRSILVLGKDFIQVIDNTTIYPEKMDSPNFTVDNKKFCLSLHYNGDSSYLFANGKKTINFKAKDSGIKVINFKVKDSGITPYPLCLGGLLTDFAVGYMRATGLTGYAYGFSVDYWAIANDKILDIHKYLMEKNGI